MDWPTDRPIVVADWWYCGDECSCSHPRIRRLVPPVTRDEHGWRWADGDQLEEGPWASYGDEPEDTTAQWRWLLEAARRHKVDNLAEVEKGAEGYL